MHIQAKPNTKLTSFIHNCHPRMVVEIKKRGDINPNPAPLIVLIMLQDKMDHSNKKRQADRLYYNVSIIKQHQVCMESHLSAACTAFVHLLCALLILGYLAPYCSIAAWRGSLSIIVMNNLQVLLVPCFIIQEPTLHIQNLCPYKLCKQRSWALHRIIRTDVESASPHDWGSSKWLDSMQSSGGLHLMGHLSMMPAAGLGK